METPDVTPVQLRAVLLWLFSALGLIGVNVAGGTQDAILLVAEGFLVTVLPTLLVVADALIRRARANNATAILSARERYGAPGESYVNEG